MEEREILEPFELHYSDLISLSSGVNTLSSPSVSRDEIERLDAITSGIMENLGPTGPGLIVVTGVPDSLNLRKSLLPLARDLALLNNEDRKRILQEHRLGSDVPLKNLDRCVSSFAMQLKYQHNPYSSTPKWENLKHDDIHDTVEECLAVDKLRVSLDDKFKNLGSSFRELGICMTNLGLSLARICDRAIGGQELEQSLIESHAVKARLIHYHSALDTLLIKQSGRQNGYTKEHSNHRFQHYGSAAEEHSSRNNLIHEGGDERQLCEKHFELWQQWHYDYDI
ncbi:hypothetical protein Nepgr_027639 [Nepenthes gracilis]|uniref:Uncharacterized protein n=1 Tax=Nepenthes gracilis TaxID=150966 RepID=A0AAD3TAW2_NEPGR|nr:hypothetical protein Nepgr_027639 [Nepenthes gracilis]